MSSEHFPLFSVCTFTRSYGESECSLPFSLSFSDNCMHGERWRERVRDLQSKKEQMAAAQVPLDRVCHQLLHLFIGAFDVIKARVVLLVPHQLPFLPSAVHRALLLLSLSSAVSNFSFFFFSLFSFSRSRALGNLKIQRLQDTKANALLHVSMRMVRC